MGGYAYRYRHEDVSASEAVSPPEEEATKPGEDGRNPVKVILMFGSWNKRFNSMREDAIYIAVTVVEKLRASMSRSSPSGDYHCVKYFTVQVDEDDMCLDICTRSVEDGGLEAPPELPCLLLLAHPSKNDETNNTKMRVEHVECSNAQLERLLVEHLARLEEDWPRKNPSPSLLKENLESSVKDAWSRLFDAQGNLLPPQPKQSKGISMPIKRMMKNNEPAVRIFVAGDKSQVGKSSICMGLLGALLKSGRYAPSDLAYIKPATQCEAVQLVEEFCKHKGITACVPVGPIVYYKGFTRSFLKGETGETSADLLQKASDAVDTLAAGKKVVIIDGVGYPAVGSITGTDNASVARASGRLFSIPGSTSTTSSTLERAPVPVLLIGKSGVGDAIDSFNINATYFSHQNVPVLGAIFNKMNLDGFYSLANCKEAIDLYFDKYQNDKQAFGYIPEIPMLKNARENVANISEEDQLKEAVKTAELFVEKFAEHVNVDAIVNAARKATTSYIESLILANNDGEKTISGTKRSIEEMVVAPTINGQSKYPRLTPKSESPGFALSREQIEAMASAAGAAGG